MKKLVFIVCTVFSVTAAFYGAAACAREIEVNKSFSVKNESIVPVAVDLSSLNSTKEVTVEMHPYSGDFTSVKNELTIYRLMYITVAIVIMTALALGAKKR